MKSYEIHDWIEAHIKNEKLVDILEWIVDIPHEIGWRLRYFQRFLGRLWAWIPFLWTDEDWDSWHLIKMMQFKIRRMRLYIQWEDRHTRVEEDCKAMLIAEEYLQRLLDDDWHIHGMDKELCTCPEDPITWEDHDGSNYRTMVSHFCSWCRNGYRRKINDARQKAFREEAFKHIEKNYQRWWS